MTRSRILIRGVVTLVGLAAGALAAPEAPPTEALLRYRFEPGQTLRVRTTGVWTMKFGAAGSAPTNFFTTIRTEFNRAEKVVELTDEIATVATQTDRATVTGKGVGDNEKGSYGSSYKDGKISAYTLSGGKRSPAEATSEWVATQFARLDVTGKAQPYQGKPVATRNDYWRPTFPINPVKVGETWKTRARFAPAPVTSPAGVPELPAVPDSEVDLTLTHTLVRVRTRSGRRVATIETVGTQRELVGMISKSTAVIEASTEFDIDRGVILSGKSHATEEGQLQHETASAGADQQATKITVATRKNDQTTVQLVESKSRK